MILEYTKYLASFEALFEQEDYAEALEVLDGIYRNNDKKIDADVDTYLDYHSMRGLCLYHLENYSESIKSFSSFLNVRPDSPNVLFMRAKCYDYSDDLDRAEADYRDTIRIDPKAPAAHCFLALILEAKGELKEAEKMHQKALKANPDDTVSKLRLRVILKEQ